MKHILKSMKQGHAVHHKESILPVMFVSLVCLLFVSLHGCRHQHEPWSLDQYIQALERPDRDADQKPDEVLDALEIGPGMAIADIGAGSGYFTRRFASAVGRTGKVYAVDVEAKMLDYNKQKLRELGSPDITEFILAKPHDPELPPNSVDLIFLCNVYHHLDHHAEYFARLTEALRPGGRVAIIDFYADERSGELEFPKEHLVPETRVIHELGQAGYKLRKQHVFLKRQYFLEFISKS